MSGVVFAVMEASPRRALGASALYFCCPACAAYYSAHEAEVQTLRGFPRSG